MGEHGRQMTDKAKLFLYQWKAFWSYQAKPCPELEPEFKYVPARKFAADWALPEYRILIAVNGGIGMERGGHSGWTGIHNDYRRARLAAANQYWFFPCSTHDLENDPIGTIRPIFELMKQIDLERG